MGLQPEEGDPSAMLRMTLHPVILRERSEPKDLFAVWRNLQRSFGYAQDDNVGARHKKVDALITKVDALSKKSARDNKKSVRRTNVTVMTIERSDEESQSVTDLSQKKPLASPRRIS